MNNTGSIEQEIISHGLTATELETFVMERATVTIAPINGATVINVESRDPRADGVYEAKGVVVLGDCHINDCRQDAEELGIDLKDAIALANQPDTDEQRLVSQLRRAATIAAGREATMFDSDVHGTVLDTIGRDLRATADYLLFDREDGDEARRRKLVLHVTAARDMLNDMLDDIEEDARA